MIDPIVKDILVATEDSGKPEGGKTSYPDYPCENPSKTQKTEWIDTWDEDLQASGFSALLRGELPFEIAKLSERPAITIPEGTDPARAAVLATENDRIATANAVNKLEAESRTKEIRVRVAAKINRALRKTAPLLLSQLQKAHRLKDASGTEIADAYDGVEMFLALKAKKSDAVSRYDTKKYDQCYEKMRDNKVEDNVSPDRWAKRITTFTVHINPYKQSPLVGEELSQFIVEQLPTVLASDGRNLVRAAKAAGKFDDDAYITKQTQEIVEDAYNPGKKPAAMLSEPTENGNGKSVFTRGQANKMIAAALKDYKSKAST